MTRYISASDRLVDVGWKCLENYVMQRCLSELDKSNRINMHIYYRQLTDEKEQFTQALA